MVCGPGLQVLATSWVQGAQGRAAAHPAAARRGTVAARGQLTAFDEDRPTTNGGKLVTRTRTLADFLDTRHAAK